MSSDKKKLALDVSKDGEKLNLLEYVLCQHSLFGLCFSRSGPAPVNFGCGCCPVTVGDLPIRQRFFIFFFGVVITFCIALEVTIGDLNGFLAFLVTLVIVTPLSFYVKGILPAVSDFFRAQCATLPVVRVEELLLLFLFLFWAIHGMARAGDAGVVLRAFATLWQTMLALWVAEVIALVWTYLFCAICCGCCLPEKSEFQNALAPVQEPSSDKATPTAKPTEGDRLV